MKVWQTTAEMPEGKYLVVRRDGTIPWWGNFVMGEHDPASAAGLRGYADKARELGYETEYVASLYELADQYERTSKAYRGRAKVDPEAPPHRHDDTGVVSLMKGSLCPTSVTLVRDPQP